MGLFYDVSQLGVNAQCVHSPRGRAPEGDSHPLRTRQSMAPREFSAPSQKKKKLVGDNSRVIVLGNKILFLIEEGKNTFVNEVWRGCPAHRS